jgi:chemotaxis family two-component system sensor kinase Cph1
MKIKDIVNREVVNLTNCESEPIHIPGSIQPFGFLLGIKNETQVIDFCSANCTEYTGLSPEQVLGKTLTDLFQQDQSAAFSVYQESNKQTVPFVFTLNGWKFNTSVHISGDILILDFEPFPKETINVSDLFIQTRSFVSILEKNSYLPELCQDIADETRAITGYDRVMIYRFDEEYNGEVIAESKREDIVSFAGQKYPHTDIPVQARELYIRNPLRVIADIGYQPVPLLTLQGSDEKSNRSLDLSLSILRSVSPIHIEYLKNMGVGATLTISLLNNNRLWGLIACHHYSPKAIPYNTRLSALLQGHFLTSQIAVREVAEEFEIGQGTEKALLDSLSLLHEHEDFIESYYDSPSLLNLANAGGFAIYYKGKLFKSGNVPPNEDLIPLMKTLSEKYPDAAFQTEQLINQFPGKESLSRFAAGFIYHAIAGVTPDGLIWMRPERREMINWAGNPHKAVIQNEDGIVRLSPRKSFELWLEEVKDQSEKWRKSEINATSSFAYALQKFINLRYVRTQENQNRLLNDELKAANKELANLNWISTHDLKEPLRKIQIFASKVLDRENPDLTALVKDSVERMRFAAEKMQLLIEDILTYSKTGNTEKVYESVDLNTVLEKVLKELSENIEEKKAVITSGDLPTLNIIPFQVHQLFVNLLSNALKFTREHVAPVISIEVQTVQKRTEKAQEARDYYEISFQDNGIGFEKEYENRIFDVFQRLHPNHKYPGSGIGLAICKKIMENHAGFIAADSEFGQGSIFRIYFPRED